VKVLIKFIVKIQLINDVDIGNTYVDDDVDSMAVLSVDTLN
jgi:hypothetical protein